MALSMAASSMPVGKSVSELESEVSARRHEQRQLRAHCGHLTEVRRPAPAGASIRSVQLPLLPPARAFPLWYASDYCFALSLFHLPLLLPLPLVRLQLLHRLHFIATTFVLSPPHLLLLLSSLSRYPVRNFLFFSFPFIRSARLVSAGRCALLVSIFSLGVACAIADATPAHHHHHPPSGVSWEQVRESHDPCHGFDRLGVF